MQAAACMVGKGKESKRQRCKDRLWEVVVRAVVAAKVLYSRG